MTHATFGALIAVLVCAGSATARADDTVRVGSKVFTESVILGEIATLAAERTGARVEHRRELGGTRVVWSALVRGDIDVLPEYTGTLRQEVYGAESVNDDTLAARLAKDGMRMSEPLGFDDTYALGMKEARAAALGIDEISDLKGHVDLQIAFSAEFTSRADGWGALKARYGLAHADIKAMDHDLAYRALADGTVDLVDLYSTDAEIRHYGLRVLRDDLRHFPAYRAVFVYRADLETRAPRVVEALRAFSGKIDEATMIRMNAAAKIDRRPERAVAAELVGSVVGQKVATHEETRRERLMRATWQHLGLSAAALALAIPVAVPLGFVAAKRRRLGRFLLGFTGIVQTLPSLALLVFLLPWLGLGAAPAIAALALYALLPIVRSTHSGVTGIAAGLRESAEVLGLPPWYRVLRIELPLALPSILAGLQIAAVTTVGTATLGALVGAGGYGQAILTGIRLDRMDLILEGAIPAALLAIVTLGVFEVLERRLVPRGLRL
jgi:osmoprotectant transport system permease protein